MSDRPLILLDRPRGGLGQVPLPPYGDARHSSRRDQSSALIHPEAYHEHAYNAPQSADEEHQHRGRPDLPPWLYQPVNWENIDQLNYAMLPAIGSTVVIISYQVPPGRNGIINKVANNFVGGGWVEGSGDLIWRILVDGTPPPGATNYDTILDSLGSPPQPTPISGFRIFENQVISAVAFNNPAGPSGGVVVSGQRVGARLMGWTYPRDIEEADIWI